MYFDMPLNRRDRPVAPLVEGVTSAATLQAAFAVSERRDVKRSMNYAKPAFGVRSAQMRDAAGHEHQIDRSATCHTAAALQVSQTNLRNLADSHITTVDMWVRGGPHSRALRSVRAVPSSDRCFLPFRSGHHD
jgi:hypothetical protein